MLNGISKSFDGRFRDESLTGHWFSDIVHGRKIIYDWRQDYNECGPHSSLNYQTLSELAVGWRTGTLQGQPDIPN